MATISQSRQVFLEVCAVVARDLAAPGFRYKPSFPPRLTRDAGEWRQQISFFSSRLNVAGAAVVLHPIASAFNSQFGRWAKKCGSPRPLPTRNAVAALDMGTWNVGNEAGTPSLDEATFNHRWRSDPPTAVAAALRELHEHHLRFLDIFNTRAGVVESILNPPDVRTWRWQPAVAVDLLVYWGLRDAAESFVRTWVAGLDECQRTKHLARLAQARTLDVARDPDAPRLGMAAMLAHHRLDNILA